MLRQLNLKGNSVLVKEMLHFSHRSKAHSTHCSLKVFMCMAICRLAPLTSPEPFVCYGGGPGRLEPHPLVTKTKRHSDMQCRRSHAPFTMLGSAAGRAGGPGARGGSRRSS